MVNFNLYFDSTLANSTVSTISTKNTELSTALDSIRSCLEEISLGWGNEQTDFNKFRTSFETCLSNYGSLVGINNSICTFVNDYIAHVESISSNERSGE